MKTKRISILIGVSLLVVSCSFFFYDSGSTAGRPGNSEYVQGRVISEFGPVEGAEVRVTGQEQAALTDKKGQFSLPLGLSRQKRFRVVAGKEGWFNNGTLFLRGQDAEIILNPVPRADHAGYRFKSPTVCSECHTNLTKVYEKSKMAHTASNPLVLQMYNGTDAFNRTGHGPGFKVDNPGVAGDCVTCHAPSVAVSSSGTRDLNEALTSKALEWDGISCDYCHKIRRVVKSKSSPSGFKAVLQRQEPQQGNAILVFGPYKDVSVPPMAASFSPVYEKGQYCSTCHSHKVSLKDGQSWNWEGVYSTEEWKAFGIDDNSTLPVQTTYQEWRQWQSSLDKDDPNKGKNCQNCHMSWRKDMLPYDNHVVDGHIRQMWGTYRSAQSIHPHQFDGGTHTQLKTAVTLEIEGQIEKDMLTVTAYVSNTNGGHWVPTGETMRSMILVVDARDEDDQPLKLSTGKQLPASTGEGDPSKGNYAGLPGIEFSRVLQDEDGNLNVPFWKATAIAKDNRIRPKSTVAYKWQFKMKNPDGEPMAAARLVYRPVSKELAASKKWLVSDILITESAW